MTTNTTIAVSRINDGSMSAAVPAERRDMNRSTFLTTYGIAPTQTILVHLSYESDDYRRYFTVSPDFAGDGIITPSTLTADGLFTSAKNLALLLPIADCIGAVLYDPVHQIIGLTHLGRHNLLQAGGSASIEYMTAEFATVPADVQVWLSPSAGRESYPLYDFNNRSLNEVATEQFLSIGVKFEHVSFDARDTTKDLGLFSHSEYLKGNRTSDGRQAIVAMMRP